MPSVQDRRASRGAPSLPSPDDLDGLVGLDTESNLLDSLIDEAGDADADAILATGLPDDYDPDPNGVGQGGGGAQVGRVFKFDADPVDMEAPSAGNTRVGVLPRIARRQESQVQSRLAAQASVPAPAIEDIADDEAEPSEPEVELVTVSDDLPEEVDLGPERGEQLPDLDEDLMAELSAPGRSVASSRATTDAPPPPPPEPQPVPVARIPDANSLPPLPDLDAGSEFMLNLDLSAPKRSCVLLLDPETPGIEKLRWQQLARVMRAQGQDEPRMATHAAEFREVPANLLMSIYHSVAARHGLAVAISCIHQTESEQVLVCTRDVFDQELARLLSGVRRATDQLAKQMAELKAVSSHLEFLSAIN